MHWLYCPHEDIVARPGFVFVLLVNQKMTEPGLEVIFGGIVLVNQGPLLNTFQNSSLMIIWMVRMSHRFNVIQV